MDDYAIFIKNFWKAHKPLKITCSIDTQKNGKLTYVIFF